MSTIKGKFVSVWSEGQVETPCTLDTDTGELNPDVADTWDMGTLEREYFEDDAGNEYTVCPTCHEYITKKVMGDRADLSYGEIDVCSNSNCEE
jgi:hypothetical protein